MSNSKSIHIGGVTWQRNTGKHVDAIGLEEIIDHALKTGTPAQAVLAFNTIGKHIWHGKSDTLRTAAGSQLDRLKPVVEGLLVGAGWEVHILDPLKRSEATDYIHAVSYGLHVHEVPFTVETNIELRLDELCNESGNIRQKEETLALLKGRIGLDAFDVRDLSEEDRDYVLAVMQQEERDLEYLHNVEGQDLTTGEQGFRWFRDDEEAEDEARDYLTDDAHLWKEAVAAGNTTDGLEEWVEDAIRMDGWAEIIGSYDGLERVAQLKDGTWFPYIRTN